MYFKCSVTETVAPCCCSCLVTIKALNTNRPNSPSTIERFHKAIIIVTSMVCKRRLDNHIGTRFINGGVHQVG